MGVWSTFRVKVKSFYTSADVKERVDVIENSLYGKISSADYQGLQALAQLVTALCNNKTEAVVDGGVYIFYKQRSDDGAFKVFHKRLTVEERSIIDKKPTLLRDPCALLENIEKGVALSSDYAQKLRQIASAGTLQK